MITLLIQVILYCNDQDDINETDKRDNDNVERKVLKDCLCLYE